MPQIAGKNKVEPEKEQEGARLLTFKERDGTCQLTHKIVHPSHALMQVITFLCTQADVEIRATAWWAPHIVTVGTTACGWIYCSLLQKGFFLLISCPIALQDQPAQGQMHPTPNTQEHKHHSVSFCQLHFLEGKSLYTGKTTQQQPNFSAEEREKFDKI